MHLSTNVRQIEPVFAASQNLDELTELIVNGDASTGGRAKFGSRIDTLTLCADCRDGIVQ